MIKKQSHILLLKFQINMKFILNASAFNEYMPEEVTAWFNNQEKCRYEWIVQRVEKKNVTECFSEIHIIWKDFIIRQTWTGVLECDWGWNNLYIQYSLDNLPKEWDYIYWISSIKDTNIIRVWKEHFDAYPEIPLCKWWDIPQFSQNIWVLWISVLCIIIIWIWFFWIKKSLKKFKHKK